MLQVNQLETLLEQINTGKPVLIYFSAQHCSVCTHLKPKIQKTILSNFEKIKMFEVKSELHKEITSHFSVFSIPTTLVFFDQKEFLRVGRNVSLMQLTHDIQRVYDIFFRE